jgi:hypothetical protein
MRDKRRADTNIDTNEIVPTYIRVGKDEMNLIELPFTLLSSRNPDRHAIVERHWQGVGEDGRTREFYKIVTGHPQFGLPTFQAEEVYIALMELTNRQGFSNRRVHTTQYEVLKIMRWTGGSRYRALIRALDQMGAVWISTNAFWNNKASSYEKVGFGIIDDYRFFEQERKGRRKKRGDDQPLSFVDWNQILFDSFKRGFIKTLDPDVYFSLSTNTAKRLFRYADKHLYRREIQEIDLFRLAFDKLEMSSNYRYPSQIIRELKHAIAELKEKKLSKIRIVKSKTTASGYKVVFSPITNPQVQVPQLELDFEFDSPSKAEEQRSAEEELDAEVAALASELQKRGISKSQSQKLSKRYPDRIGAKLQMFDLLLEQQSSLVQKNPAGWLVRAIEEDYQPSKHQIREHERKKRRWEAEDRKARWLEHREVLIQTDLANWDKTSPEERAKGPLGFWIAVEKSGGPQPTPEQIEAKRQELIDNLPKTDEEKREYIALNYPEEPPDDFE